MPARTWLVGEYNPLSAAPEHALYPHPPGCTGARLCRTLGLSQDEYLRRFERRNLLRQARWSAPLARAAADALLAEAKDGDRVVLLGARVAAAFGFEFRDVLWTPCVRISKLPRTGVVTLVLPHPSGRSRLWNAPGAGERARAAVTELEAQ